MVCGRRENGGAGRMAVIAAVAFGALLALVAAGWSPLLAVDRAVALEANEVLAGRPLLTDALAVVTALGGAPTSWLLLAGAAGYVLVRRRPRLALFVIVTGLGVLVLDPALKELVGRPRPVVPLPLATAPGNSFPSGHALGSFVTYATLVLLFLPAVPRKARRAVVAGAAAVVVAVGATRVALGVHYVSDVLGGWLLGTAWLGVTAAAFQARTGRLGQPLREGLVPGAAQALAPAPGAGSREPGRGRQAVARLLAAWVLVLGVVVGAGLLVTEVLAGGPVDALEEQLVAEVVEERTPALNRLSSAAAMLGGTPFVVGSAVVVAPLVLALTRRWRPLLFLAATMVGEVTLFLAAGEVVGRPRPAVPHLDSPLPPTASFPSGHVSAAIAWYGALALLARPRLRAPWRQLIVAAAVVAVILVAAARVYRGVHHPTDVLGSLLLAVPWLVVTARTLLPDPGAEDPA